MKKYRISYLKHEYGLTREPYHEKKEFPFSTDEKAKEYYDKINQNAKRGLNPFGKDEKDIKYWYEFISLTRIDREEEATIIA